jgi:hypothetical protein
MNYFEAHEILERVKHGYKPSIKIINHALFLTGDIEELGSTGMDSTAQRESERTWSEWSQKMVGYDN